jgi:hypothetical protein
MPKLADYDEEIEKYFILMEEILLVLNSSEVLIVTNSELPNFL